MGNPKFREGDVVVRSAYRDHASAMMRDECTIVTIVAVGPSFCKQLWYLCKDYRGRECNGLVSVMDECFEVKTPSTIDSSKPVEIIVA